MLREVRGCWVKGGVWDRSCRARTVLDSIPSIASILPKMRMMRGSGGTIPLRGGGAGVRGPGTYVSESERERERKRERERERCLSNTPNAWLAIYDWARLQALALSLRKLRKQNSANSRGMKCAALTVLLQSLWNQTQLH